MTFNPNQPRKPDGTWSGSIIDRLEFQLHEKKVANPRDAAIEHLQRSSILHPNTEELTNYGYQREFIGARGRELSRDKHNHVVASKHIQQVKKKL
jgi:hypothetical protein